MRITGNMINYYFVCTRKLWLFSKGLQFEEGHENVQLGKLIDQESYSKKEKQIVIDDTIAIDFLERWRVLHEVKKSRAIEPAAKWQLRYYIYYLQQKGVPIEKGFLDYPKLKERFEVNLSQKEKEELRVILNEIEKIVSNEKTPKVEKKKICLKCAYYEFCFS
jgi:CRISPR-associated exonuclease Cas4